MTIFSSDQLDALAKMIPDTLPEGHSAAIVGGIDQHGAQVEVRFQKDYVGATWQAIGAYQHSWSGDNSVGAKFIVSWLLVLCALVWSAPVFAQLPDAHKTPGKARPLTKTTICMTTWGKDARHVTLAMKKQVFAQYGIPWEKHADYEVDHLVSRELGGADDIANLWPEPWFLTVSGKEMGAHQKDRAENATHKAVCAGTIALNDAQDQIVTDWTQLYLRFVGPFPKTTK